MAGTSISSSAVFRAAFFILIVGFIFLVISLITPNWTEISVGDVIISGTGIWKTCMETNGLGKQCAKSIYEEEGWFVAVKTFECLGVACLSFELIMSLVLLVVANQRLARVNIYTGIFAAIFIISGTATYTSKSNLYQLGYSYWISWLSVGLVIVAIILLECSRKKDYEEQMTAANTEVMSEDTSESMDDNVQMSNVFL